MQMHNHVVGDLHNKSTNLNISNRPNICLGMLLNIILKRVFLEDCADIGTR